MRDEEQSVGSVEADAGDIKSWCAHASI
jgi:hypothetical protein